MDYKEKYEQALEVAQRFYNNSVAITKKGLEDIFPELAGSEDERIRKRIIDLIKEVVEDDSYHVYRFDEMIAWLEKQGQDGKVWFYRDDYVRDKKQAYQDGIDNVLNNPQKYGLEKREIKEHDVCDTCDEKASCVNPCSVKLIEEQKPAEWGNICEFSLKTWNDIVAYVLKEHNGIGNYLDDPEVRNTAKKLHKKYKFDCANEEWDRVYRRGLDAGINYGKTEALRVQAPVEWSDEDEKFINRSIMYLRQYNSSESEVKKQGAQSCINWLEALGDGKLNDPSIVKYKAGDKVRFFSDSEVFTISKVENWRYIFADGGGDTSVYEELIPVKESKDTLTRDKVKCGDYVVNKDGTVIKVHDIDNFGHVCYYYFANEMTEDGGKIQDNRAFMKYYGVIQDCHIATQSEIDFLEKWVAHKKYIWVENNVSPDDEEED